MLRFPSLLALSLIYAAHTGAHSLVSRDATFDWSNLTSSTNLSWTPCYDTYQCAKLTVPLYYSDPDAGEAQIALIRSPSNYSSGDPRYLGPILFNPGGPGGSGTSYLLEFGTYFRAIIGPQYDLVGFDPRGIGFTTPSLSLFTGAPEALQFYSTYPQNVNESVSSFGRFYAQAQILGQLAKDRYEDIAQSVGTAAVATDMLMIGRAFGVEKVGYWGVSYGSILGATFAAMYPNNVGRFIIDGVFNAHDWYQGNWSASLLDTDASLNAVYAACAITNTSACALHEPSISAIGTRVRTLLDQIHLAPQPVYNASSGTFGVADYTVVFLQLFQTLYQPYSSAPAMFAALRALEAGDAAPIFAGSVTYDNDLLATCDPAFDRASGKFVVGFLDVSAPIACGDVYDEGDRIRSRVEAEGDLAAMRRGSVFAETWYPLSQGRCVGWNITARDRFNGSFIQNTSTPILLLSNLNDPVTPSVGAANMSSSFAGSVVLHQNSTGHTSLSGFSTCTARAIRAYFADGTLPAPGMLCQADTEIFQSPGNSSAYSGVSPINLRELEDDAEEDGLEDGDFTEAVRALGTSGYLVREVWRPW